MGLTLPAILRPKPLYDVGDFCIVIIGGEDYFFCHKSDRRWTCAGTFHGCLCMIFTRIEYADALAAEPSHADRQRDIDMEEGRDYQ